MRFPIGDVSRVVGQNWPTSYGNNNLYFRLARDQVVLLETAPWNLDLKVGVVEGPGKTKPTVFLGAICKCRFYYSVKAN